jgi:hypothetical protein
MIAARKSIGMQAESTTSCSDKTEFAEATPASGVCSCIAYAENVAAIMSRVTDVPSGPNRTAAHTAKTSGR